MIEARRVHQYKSIADVITDRFGNDLPILACIGNDEQESTIRELQDITSGRIRFLDAGTEISTYAGKSIGVTGVPVAVSRSEPEEQGIKEIFAKRSADLAREIAEVKRTCEVSILLMHYSPISPVTFPTSFTVWLSRAFEKHQPDIIVHGHIHYSTNPELRVGNTRVLNVAFPATNTITEIEL